MTLPKTLPRAIAVITALGVLALTGCGSDDADDSGATDAGQTDQPSGPASGGPGGGGFGDVDFEAIQECLEAAGLEDAFPSDLPTDMPTDRPTDMPTDFPTDGTPPEGFPSGGPGGGAGGALQDPEVQAALEACGIDLPQAPGAGQS